jgi:phage gp36-like protein
MAIVALSTQASVEARIGSTRLAGFTDFNADGTPDPATLEAAFLEASAIICGRLEGLYGTTEIDTWDSSTAPQLVRSISDQLCVRQYYVGNPRFQEPAQQAYENALELLEQIATGIITLYDNPGTVSGIFDVDRIPSDFDPERDEDDMTVRTTWVLPDNRELPGY